MTSDDETDTPRDEPKYSDTDQKDHEIAEKVYQAVAGLQEAIDASLLAGLIVEPSFARVENHLTRYGTRINSFVCNVHVYRQLT